MKRITLELSLKPFKETNEEYIRGVCRGIFEQWRPLLKNVNEIAVMLWTADGSEILEYNGKLEDTFEWCYYIGGASLPLVDENDRDDIGAGEKKRLYMENPPVMTYGILKNITRILREEGKRMFPDASVRIGETFDIGPEFADSDFKYNRHTEILGLQYINNKKCIDSTAVLNGDNHKYAAFPNGIPDKTPFGLFLGKQTECFLKDLGFDYLWLSNGLGFSDCPWVMDGKIYDGERFYPERLETVKDNIFEFWKRFREGCPDFPIETRGTNNSVGIDYATDGVPLQKIYDSGLNIEPPPNLPWAAINDNFGLEIMGHMTRIANLPGDRFMFRFYVHDPWWINSPWYDRYDSNPHDIYLPMSIARIDSDGNVQSADNLNILSIDNSFGNMPDCCVNEPIPHLIKADKDKSDEPSPFVWVYPVREYTESKTESELREMYIGDRFVEKSINDGFPLNCVVSTDNFLGHDKNVYMKSVLVSPVPKCSRVLEKFIEFAECGIKTIFYGTKESLAELPKNAGFISVDTESGVLLREAAAKTDYVMIHNRADSTSKVPALTVNKSNNGYWFSVYNPDNTTESLLKFPQGAPILLGGSTEIKDGFASYHFSMSEHRECRIFVKQRDGVVKARERVSINIRNKRRIGIFGLRDAEIIYYPEKNTVCDATAAAGPFDPEDNFTPVYSDKFKLVNDPEYGKYYKAEHISGDFAFYVTREKTK